MSSATQHVWYYQKTKLLSVVDEGPFTDAQMLQLANESQLSLQTLLRSPTRTKNQWIHAERVPAIAVAINQAKLDADTKKKQEGEARRQLAEEERADRNLERQKANQEKAAAEKNAPPSIETNSLIEKIKAQVAGILTTDERIEFIIAQEKPVMIKADAGVCTNRRLIIFRPKMLGRFDFTDYLWRDLSDAHLTQGIIASKFAAKHVSGVLVELDWLPKAGAQRLYQYCQEREERAFHDRRQMKMEESAAGAAKINVGVPNATTPSVATDGPVKRLQALKEMQDAGLISTEEFETKKKEILASI